MRDAVSFLFGRQEHTVSGLPHTMTVLEWLRTEAGAIGTKEGCAEGDCGACTVVVGHLDGDAIVYRPVNSCIMLLAQLDGLQLITVEHLRGDDGALHPVQQAMVDHHGSQCGFCTPGFVMSLFAMHHSAAGAATVNEDLAGNLCRCTGYRPIVDAARAACATPPDDAFTHERAATTAWLRAHRPTALSFGTDRGRYLAPVSLDAAAELFQLHSDATLLAGGTDVGLWVTKEHRSLPRIVALGAVPELRQIESGHATILLGAAATYDRCLPVLERFWPQLGAMLRRLGSRQIRNLGTVGGNLGTASPIGDMAPALLALDACVHLRAGSRARVLPLAEYFLGYRRTALQPGEFITAVELPKPVEGDILHVHKVSKRFEEDISAVCAAFHLRLRDGVAVEFRAGWGGMAATPVRAKRLESAVVGQLWNAATVDAGMAALDAELVPLSDMRASSAYRSAVARNLLLRFFLETNAASGRVRLAARAA